jgi:hypothetical protein
MLSAHSASRRQVAMSRPHSSQTEQSRLPGWAAKWLPQVAQMRAARWRVTMASTPREATFAAPQSQADGAVFCPVISCGSRRLARVAIDAPLIEPLIELESVVLHRPTDFQVGRGGRPVADNTAAAASAQERNRHADIFGGGSFVEELTFGHRIVLIAVMR